MLTYKGIRNPTLDAFTDKIEGSEQAKRTMATNAHGLAVSRGNANSGRRPNSAFNKNASKPQSNRNRVERDRRLALRGKCFHCARGPHDPAMHLPRDCKIQSLRRHGSCYARLQPPAVSSGCAASANAIDFPRISISI